MSPSALATVGDLITQQVSLYAHCKGCQHSSSIDLRSIVERHGLNYPAERVLKRLRCMNCSKWDAEIRLVPAHRN